MNPLSARAEQENTKKLPENAVSANQGSAVKFLDVTAMTNYYDQSSSGGNTGRAVMNMFSCAPRKLRVVEGEHGRSSSSSSSSSPRSKFAESRAFSFRGPSPAHDDGRYSSNPGSSTCLFDVKILERHPFTFQTFVPLSLDRDDASTAYLVIVAPTLPSPEDARVHGRKGPGLPDLQNTKAFIARGNQAVTYAAGTWHAPMVVLGARTVDFVVVQFANGVAEDDCQEVELLASDGEGVAVELELELGGADGESAVKARM